MLTCYYVIYIYSCTVCGAYSFHKFSFIFDYLLAILPILSGILNDIKKINPLILLFRPLKKKF